MKLDAAWDLFGSSLGFVRLVLLVDWDPIGIFGVPAAMDEYDIYAVNAHNMLLAGATQEDLVSYLRFVQRESMGVKGKSEPQLAIIAARVQDEFDTATEE